MSPDLLVVIPSRGRPESVERMALAFMETGAEDLPVIWALDQFDGEYSAEHEAYRDAVAKHFGYGEVLSVGAGNMVSAINGASRYAVEAHEPFAIAVLNDDHLPRSPDWADEIVKTLHELDPCGLVYPDDGLRGEQLATVWATHAAWVSAIGRMVPARVEHLYTDNAMMDLATALGRITYRGDLLIEHMTPYAKKAEFDPGYRRVNSRERHENDRAVFRQWQTSAKREQQIAALRGLGGAS